MNVIEATKFTGTTIEGIRGIEGYLSTDSYEQEMRHRVAERAMVRATKTYGRAYAIIAGRPHEMKEFCGEAPAGWREIETRYEQDGVRYYLNFTHSHYLSMLDLDALGRPMSYLPTLAVCIT